MNSDTPPNPPKRRSKLARILTALILLIVCGVVFVGHEHRKLIETCNFRAADPQDKLAACDTLLKWTAHKPSTRSLIYRHKMRVYMTLDQTDEALHQVDLAINADPESSVPWQWKATILARAEKYPAALEAIDTALELQPGYDFSLETKAKLFQRMRRWEDLENLVADAIDDHDVGAWAWSYSGYLKLRNQSYRDAAAAFATALRLRPDDTYSRRKFFEACRAAGADCPELFPEHSHDLSKETCDQVINKFSTALSEKLDGEVNLVSVSNGVLQGYAAGLRILEEGKLVREIEKFLEFDRLVACMLQDSSESGTNWFDKILLENLDRAYPIYIRDNATRWGIEAVQD